MIAKIDKLQEGILDLKYNRKREGLKIGIPQIDEYLRYKQGEMVLLVGAANCGKTTFTLYLFTIWALKHKLRFLIWSSENTVNSLARKIIEFKMNKPIQLASDGEIQNTLKWFDKYFKLIDVRDITTYKDLLKEAKDILNAWKYDCLLVDPYNSLAMDKDLLKVVGGHEYHYEVSSRFRLFCKENGVTMYINAHGVTSQARMVHPRGHEYEGLPMPMSAASVEGGSKWLNRSDGVLVLHRYNTSKTDWMYTFLFVVKVKETETGGRCTSDPLKFRMAKNGVGFEFMDKNILDYKKEINEIEF